METYLSIYLRIELATALLSDEFILNMYESIPVQNAHKRD
jgi:hypothetical protein